MTPDFMSSEPDLGEIPALSKADDVSVTRSSQWQQILAPSPHCSWVSFQTTLCASVLVLFLF